MPDVPERFANQRDNRRFVEREFSSRAKVTDQDARSDPRFDFSRKSMCQAPGKDADEKLTTFLELEPAIRKNSIDAVCQRLAESRSR